MKPITVYIPFTRPESVEPFFNDLRTIGIDLSLINLAITVDRGEIEGVQIYEKIMKEMNTFNYRKFLVIRNQDHRVNEVNIGVRRERIAEIHNQVKPLIAELDGEYVLGLEDDTSFTNLNVTRLIEKLQEPNVGLVTAYEAGRWYKKIIGVWQFDNVDDPKSCWTCLPSYDFESIDAAGFYAYVTPTDLFLAHNYNTESWQPWGPDVNYGFWLRQNGYDNYVDWSQPCNHRDGDSVIEPRGNLCSEQFVKSLTTYSDVPVWHRISVDGN